MTDKRAGIRAVFQEMMTPTLGVSWLVSSVAVAFAGPFGTFATQPFSWRLVYWGGLIALAILLAVLFRMFWRLVLHRRPEWQEDFCVAALLAVTFGPCGFVLSRFIGGAAAQEALGLLGVIVSVLTVCVVTIVLRHKIWEKRAVGDNVVSPDRLLERLPDVGGTDTKLWRISSDNHHIRVIMQSGQEHRLLMRLKDAVQETTPQSGICVHRSHWVAKEAVVGVKKVDGKDVVALTCWTQLPVGPKYAANLDFAPRLSA